VGGVDGGVDSGILHDKGAGRSLGVGGGEGGGLSGIIRLFVAEKTNERGAGVSVFADNAEEQRRYMLD
jgi:hypothetical protein